MTVATKTLAQLNTAYVACTKLTEMLRDYHQGTAAPATQLGRFTVAQIDAQVVLASAALAAIDAIVD